MAPNRGSSAKSSKPAVSTQKGKPPLSSSTPRVSKSKLKSKGAATKEVKVKPRTAPELQKRKKKRVYTEKELDLPALNMVTPVGVQKPRGKKKGKVFVDDQESMMTILAMVNAEKEGQIESKMMKARRMEEIREARRKEAEVRQEQKNSKLEEIKDALRRKRKRKSTDAGQAEPSDLPSGTKRQDSSANRKRVSFAEN